MEAENTKKRVLGKGLEALITDTYVKPVQKSEVVLNKINTVSLEESGRDAVKAIPIKNIVPNHDQPRLIIKEDSLAELADSIREQGVLQPIIVTKKTAIEYELICGERRLRAAALAGLENIPAVVKEVAGDKMLELALVENIQREDLGPLEEATAYARLIEERGLTQEDVAKRVGKNRSTVANTVRLLRLPKEVQDLIANDLISAGHARALVTLLTPEHQRVMAQRIVKEHLSVRQTEEIVLGLNSGKRRAKRARLLNPHVADLERKLEQRFRTRIKIYNNKKNQGRIEIRYFSLDELDSILQTMGIERS